MLSHVDKLRLRLAGVGAKVTVESDGSDDGNDSDGGDDGNAALIRMFTAHAAAGGARERRRAPLPEGPRGP